jgi:DNA-binding NarL/FixJ family response regulator
MTIRVLMADDHRIVREGLALVLDGQSDIAIVGEAVNGKDAIAKATQMRPDVLLLDVFMPEMDGIAAARHLRVHHPEIRIVVLTMDDDPDDLRQLMDAGVAGYITKDAPSSEVIRAIRAAAQGEQISSLPTAEAPPATYRYIRNTAVEPVTFGLTEREWQILCRLTAGESNKEIGKTIGLSEKTVRNHLSSIFAKMEVSDRTQAVILALRYGLCSETAGEVPADLNFSRRG